MDSEPLLFSQWFISTVFCPTLWILGWRRGSASREEQVTSSVPVLATDTVSRSQILLFPLRSAMETRGAPAAVERWGASDHQMTPDFQMSHYKNRTTGDRAGPHQHPAATAFWRLLPSGSLSPWGAGRQTRCCKYLLGLSGSDAPAWPITHIHTRHWWMLTTPQIDRAAWSEYWSSCPQPA